MKKKLELVPLSKIKPNPYRDTERNPIDPEKIEQLVESISATDFWDGVYARPAKNSTYELAFGHHRIEAARKKGLKEIPLTIMDLDDAEMIKRMARENVVGTLEVVCEAVHAAVIALGDGKIEIPCSDARTTYIRYAPSFRQGHVPTVGTSHPYTVNDIAKFLGYVKESTGNAKNSVVAAFKTLEALETGALKSSQIKGTKINDVLTQKAEVDVKTAEAAQKVFQEQQVLKKRGAEALAKLRKQQKEQAEQLKAQEQKAKEQLEARRAAHRKAQRAENERKAQELDNQIQQMERDRQKRQEEHTQKRAELDAKIEAQKQRDMALQKTVNQHEKQAEMMFKTVLYQLETITTERYDMRDRLAYLSRNPFLNANQRESLRQVILAAAEWFTWQANNFLPRKTSNVLKDAYEREELQRKTKKEKDE